MGNFNVQGQYLSGGEAYDVEAVVKAKNEESAKAQLNWILANKHCLCNDCLDEYVKDYSTVVQVPQSLNYSMCVK